MLTAAQPARRPSPEPAGKANSPHVPTVGSPCLSHTHRSPTAGGLCQTSPSRRQMLATHGIFKQCTDQKRTNV